jgi:ABC-type transport system substrate-binding protein
MFESDPNFTVEAITQNNPASVQFNLDDPICGDRNFRMAVAHAIDREELAVFARDEWAIPMEDGTIWGYSTPYRNTNLSLIPYDLDKAKEYLEASNYNGQPVEFAVTGNTKLGEALQEQLSKIDINLTVNLMDMSSFQAYTGWNDNKAQILTFVHMLQANPVHGYRANFLPGSNNNRMRYDNPELTRMVEESMSITGEEERREHFYREQEIVYEDIPSLAIYYEIRPFIADKNIGGMVLPSSAHYDFRYTYLVVD